MPNERVSRRTVIDKQIVDWGSGRQGISDDELPVCDADDATWRRLSDGDKY